MNVLDKYYVVIENRLCKFERKRNTTYNHLYSLFGYTVYGYTFWKKTIRITFHVQYPYWPFVIIMCMLHISRIHITPIQ